MDQLSFGATAELLKNSLAGAAMTHGAIANNVANANTPGYHRIDVSFKEALAATEPTPADPNQLALVTDDPNHIPIGGDLPPVPFHVEPTIDEAFKMRVDQSNIDVDQEMARLTQNSAYGQAMTQMLNVQYSRLHSTIREQA